MTLKDLLQDEKFVNSKTNDEIELIVEFFKSGEEKPLGKDGKPVG